MSAFGRAKGRLAAKAKGAEAATERIKGKAMGLRAVRKDRPPVDGDKDGRIYDGTPMERPAPPKVVQPPPTGQDVTHTGLTVKAEPGLEKIAARIEHDIRDERLPSEGPPRGLILVKYDAPATKREASAAIKAEERGKLLIASEHRSAWAIERSGDTTRFRVAIREVDTFDPPHPERKGEVYPASQSDNFQDRPGWAFKEHAGWEHHFRTREAAEAYGAKSTAGYVDWFAKKESGGLAIIRDSDKANWYTAIHGGQSMYGAKITTTVRVIRPRKDKS